MSEYNINSKKLGRQRSVAKTIIFALLVAVVSGNDLPAQDVIETDSEWIQEVQRRMTQPAAITLLDSQQLAEPDSFRVYEPLRLLIMPAKIANLESQEIQAEVMQFAQDFLLGLSSIEILLVNNPEKFPGAPAFSPGEMVPDSLVRRISRHFEAEELLLIQVVRFVQAESVIAPSHQKYFFDYCRHVGKNVIGLFKKPAPDSTKDSKSYATQLEIRFTMMDGKTGQILKEFLLSGSQPSGSRINSGAEALAQLKSQALAEFKKFYLPGSTLGEFIAGKWMLPVGSDVGIYPGMQMEFLAPGFSTTTANSDSANAGNRIALGYISAAGVNQSHLKIVRQWQPIERGTWAVEHQGSVIGLQLVFQLPSTPMFSSMGLQLHLSPIRTADLGLGARYIQVRDDLDDLNHGFGFDGFGLYRIANNHRIDLGLSTELGVDIPFRKDDAGNTVNVVILSASFGFCTEILLSAHQDLVLRFGYRFATRPRKWEYSQDDQTYPAIWNSAAPEVGIAGFVLSIGLKHLFF